MGRVLYLVDLHHNLVCQFLWCWEVKNLNFHSNTIFDTKVLSPLIISHISHWVHIHHDLTEKEHKKLLHITGSHELVNFRTLQSTKYRGISIALIIWRGQAPLNIWTCSSSEKYVFGGMFPHTICLRSLLSLLIMTQAPHFHALLLGNCWTASSTVITAIASAVLGFVSASSFWAKLQIAYGVYRMHVANIKITLLFWFYLHHITRIR